MTEDHENKELNHKSVSHPDYMSYECRQAMLRKQFADPDVDAEWKRFHESIQPPQSASKQKDLNVSPRKEYFRFAVWSTVAAVVLFVVISRFLISNEQKPVVIFVAEQRSHNIIMEIIGDETRAMVLGDAINDPSIGAVADGHKVDFTSLVNHEIHQRTIRTPYGRDYRVILNDGTEVIMNADSKLTFPTRFRGKERVVRLEGEAYFKVAKNPQMPFVVKTDKIDTRALGTEFNVKAYKNSETHVTLIEGVVEVSLPDKSKDKIRMIPNEEASVANNALNVKAVDPQYYIQWKDGFFYYDNVVLSEILTDIGRWYNVDVEIASPSLMLYRLHFVVKRDSGIDEVLENLNNFGYLNAIKNGNKITIFEKAKEIGTK